MNDIWTIESDRLRLQVVRPGSEIYGRTRFNWNGFVNRITLDGEIEFAEPEQRDPNRGTSYGAGLCSEYQHPEALASANLGEEYPRLGNGYLTKTRPEFNFMVNEPCRPFPTIWDVAKDEIHFTTDIALCQGFAAREERWVRVQGNQVQIRTKLCNLGKRAIVAQEYNHNFLSLGGEPVTPAYALHVPGFANLAGGRFMGDNLYGNDEKQELRLHRNPEGPYLTFLDTPKEDFAPFSFRMTSDNSTLSVTEEDSFTPARAVVWGVEHCMCCEVFVQLDVAPGEEQEWTRTWTFER